MEQAIKKAIEGGYKATTTWKNTFTHDIEERANAMSVILLDPLFWQSLGKAMGWDEGKHVDESFGWSGNPAQWMWQHKMHRFIDHLIAGKDADSFFNDLLK